MANEAVNNSRPRRMRRRLLLALLVVSLGGLTWLLLPAPDPLFHGRPESEWIKTIRFFGADSSIAARQEQIERWRNWGPDGLRVLAHALDKADHPIQRHYRRLYRFLSAGLPGFLVRRLPSPGVIVIGGQPVDVILLLSLLGKDALPAAGAVARAMNSDDSAVRQSAINFFTRGADKNRLLNHLEPKAKRQLLPAFLSATQDSHWGVRNNAAVALRYYPEQREAVVPALTSLLRDSEVRVQMTAADSFQKVAPELVATSGVVSVVVRLLKNPNDQIDLWAADWLGTVRCEPNLAVPALIESLQNPNSLVASTAAQSLTRYKEQADIIVPALKQAALREDTASFALPALRQFSGGASNQGAQK